MDINQLKLALSDPALASLTDDQVQALPGFGVALLAPKPDRVTYTTLAAVWGATTAATFYAGIQAAKVATGNPQFAAIAAYVDVVLAGPGIDPSNADVPATGQMFIQAGLATLDEFNAVFYTSSFKAGSATQVSDITAARAAMGLQSSEIALEMRIQQLSVVAANAGMAVAQTAFADGTLASTTDINNAMATAVAKGI